MQNYEAARFAELKERLQRVNQLQEEARKVIEGVNTQTTGERAAAYLSARHTDKLAADILISFLEIWFKDELENVEPETAQSV